MRRREPKRPKIDDLPRCPECRSKRFVGQVNSVVTKVYRSGSSYNCCKAYYCSECLVEWGEDGSIRQPMYA